MSSLSGVLQKPLLAAGAVAAASFYADLSEKFASYRSSDNYSASDLGNSLRSNSIQESSNTSWVSHISMSKLADLSYVSRIHVPLPKVAFPGPNADYDSVQKMCHSFVVSSPVLIDLYQSAELPKVPKPAAYTQINSKPQPSNVIYQWHLPEPSAVYGLGQSNCSSVKSRTVVVLLGWLGAKQKHLKKYAEWYNSRGFHAITFTLPMAEILSYQLGGKAEHHVDLLANHLTEWLEGEDDKNLVFHTFSNTGWLTYGILLEKLQLHDPSMTKRIRGCIVDSAPVATPDPQVWASGFSAAFLKKHSIATKGSAISKESGVEFQVGENGVGEPKPAATEKALLLVLESFFEVILNLPAINRRLSDVVTLLSSRQPRCPQLYIYSSADRVIPFGSVESFVAEQRKAGREVRACNFISTPHVDHFRNHPDLYSTQLTHFLEDCVLVTGSSRGCRSSKRNNS